jgi:hypothetical protein
VDGGEEVEVLPGPQFWTEWSLTEGGIYFLTSRWLLPMRRQESTFQYHDFASERVTELLVREGSASWLAVSPDERWILDTTLAFPESELMLVENFR